MVRALQRARPEARHVRPRAAVRPPSRPALPAALTAFFFCTILSIFLAMRTTSSSMAPAGLPRAQPVCVGKRAKLELRRRQDESLGAGQAHHSRPGPRPFLTNQARGGGGGGGGWDSDSAPPGSANRAPRAPCRHCQ